MAEEKLGRHRRMWRDLIALRMLHYVLRYGYGGCCFDSFSSFLQFPSYTFFKTTRGMLFQYYIQRLFSINEHIVEGENFPLA